VLALAPGAGQGRVPAVVLDRGVLVLGDRRLGSVAGAISGVVLFRGLDFLLAKVFSGDAVAIIRLSLSGAGLLYILYFLPGGLWQLVQRWRDRYLRWVADRHDLLVPSLVADKRVEDDEGRRRRTTTPTTRPA
jgi:hypothetical protein